VGWTAAPSAGVVNVANVSISTFSNRTSPLVDAPQRTYPSLQDGGSFRLPQQTTQRRLQLSDTVSFAWDAHLLRIGVDVQRLDGGFRLGALQRGRVEFTQDFASFDYSGDGLVDDGDLLFALTLRSGHPAEPSVLSDVDNTHVAVFAQNDWRVSSSLQLNLGVRYELDTDVNNQSRAAQLNPLVATFTARRRRRDLNNVAPRIGLVWALPSRRTILRGGYGIYYDRIVLQVPALERLLDGRALPVEVRAGNVLFLDADTGRLSPGAPTLAEPFTGFILPGVGASGINILDARLRNPTVHEVHAGIEEELFGVRARVDFLYNRGMQFLIGRRVGEVFNPVVGGPDRVVNIESSGRTKYKAVLLSVEKLFSSTSGIRVSYTLSRALNYANDDQVPFLNGPVDPANLHLEYGSAPHDRRHRLVARAEAALPFGARVAGIWTISSGVPMDIMMPDGSSRVPLLPRNAGGRLFRKASDLNAFITSVNASGGVAGTPLPLVASSARFTDSFNAVDIRLSRAFRLAGKARVEPLVEVFNVFNVMNVLGTTNLNYSGFANVLVRDSEDRATAGFVRSSVFGKPVSTAGGVFGAGGPRALQVAARVSF
jgi:TonB dependent receptor-like, beta-barrel